MWVSTTPIPHDRFQKEICYAHTMRVDARGLACDRVAAHLGCNRLDQGRRGAPEEIAGLIIYLCSDEAAFVTGANIAINGGQHMQ